MIFVRFINARRRILQPMLDASNHEAGGSSSKTKKSKMQASRPTERFWPNTITASGTTPTHHEEEGGSIIGCFSNLFFKASNL